MAEHQLGLYGVVCVFAVACVVGIPAATALGEQDRPNILFIMTDDLNNDLGAYGNPTVVTPHLDRFAEQALTFDRAYCNSPQCGPSRNSFMSGFYPDYSGMYELVVRPREALPDFVSMTQHFMNHGYVAARVGKIYHQGNPGEIGTDGPDDPLSWHKRINPIGRDKELEDVTIRLSHLRPEVRDTDGLGGQLSWYADPTGRDEEHTDGMVALESIRLMQEYARGDQPFFLAVGFYRPHTPFVTPKKYFDMYDPDRIVVPRVPEGYLDTLPEPAQRSIAPRPEERDMPTHLAQKVIQAYYASITFTDANVGRLLDAVEELGLADNTIILFSSDHGYHLGENGHWKKRSLFEVGGRVPLIMSAPGMEHRGGRTEAIVEMIDFYATLSDLAGLPSPTWTQSESFAHVFEDPTAPARDSALTYERRGPGGHTIRTDRYRYSRWGDGGAEMIELYDHRYDPGEIHNLAHGLADDSPLHKVIEKLDAKLDARVAAAKAGPKDE